MESKAQEKALKKWIKEGMAGRGECQVAGHGDNAKLVGAKHKTNGNGNKPAEGGLPGEAGLKLTQDFINKI